MYVMHTKKAQVPNEAARMRQQQHRQQQQQDLQNIQRQTQVQSTCTCVLCVCTELLAPVIILKFKGFIFYD